MMTGIEMVHVPYKGGAQALTGLVGGEVNMTLNGLLATLPHIKSGKIKALAIAGKTRSPALPDVPTVDEAGVPDFQSGSWQGLLATGATPKDVIAKLNTAVVQVLNSPEIKERMAAQGADVVGDTPEQFGAFIRDEKVRWAKIVKDAGIKANDVPSTRHAASSAFSSASRSK